MGRVRLGGWVGGRRGGWRVEGGGWRVEVARCKWYLSKRTRL
jgi:hypothetical protein